MKNFVFRRFLAIVFFICLCLSLTFKVSALPMFTIHLLGIVHSDGGDRTSWQSTAQNYLSNIPNSYFFNLTAFDDDKLLTYLKTPDMFVIHTHGSPTTLLAVDADGSESMLTVSEISALAVGALDNLDLAFIGACRSGFGGETIENNIVNAIYGRGARCVIGYLNTVETSANYIMIKEFCSAIGCGYTIAEALAYADAQVLAQYGSSGNTDKRLVRGSTETSFADRGILLDSISSNSDISGLTGSQESSVGVISLQSTTGCEFGYFDFSKIGLGTSSETNIALDFGNYSFDTQKYVFSKQYFTDDTGIWTTIYTYYINGIETDDSIYFLHNSRGELVACMHPNEGYYDNVQLSDNTLEASRISLDALLRTAGINDFTLTETRLVMNDGVPSLRYSVQYEVVLDSLSFQTIDNYMIPLNEVR